jgi:cell division septation protein DedD
MAWQPNGRYYRFSADVIRACVPPSSGVYGLFKFSRQLLIGESENLRETLLAHCDTVEVISRRYRATLFSFQVCPAEERRAKAAELIDRFHPVRQSATGAIADAPLQSAMPVSEIDTVPIDLEEFSLHAAEESPPARPRYYFERAQGLALLGLFAVCMMLSFYLGFVAGENFQTEAGNSSDKALAWRPSATENRTVDLDVQNAAINETQNVASKIPGWMPSSTEPLGGGTDAKGAEESNPTLPSTDQSITTKKWSVQVAAMPVREAADALVDRLINDGYAGYLVTAQIKGQTFYRVRVGPFENQTEAQALRQTLVHHERYRQAFLIYDLIDPQLRAEAALSQSSR